MAVQAHRFCSMSEFSKAQKTVNEIERSLGATTTFNRSTLLSYQETVDEKLQPIALKYETKLHEKDVVSGEPRLGPQMREKVVKFKNQVEAISALIMEKLAGKRQAQYTFSSEYIVPHIFNQSFHLFSFLIYSRFK